MQKGTPVFLNVYDLFGGGYSLKTIGCGFHHTGVEVGKKEWTFGHSYSKDTGVFWVHPRSAQAEFKEAIFLGHSTLTLPETDALIRRMKVSWMGCEYDLLNRNCNHFSGALLTELGFSLPPWINRVAVLSSKVVPAAVAGFFVERIIAATNPPEVPPEAVPRSAAPTGPSSVRKGSMTPSTQVPKTAHPLDTDEPMARRRRGRRSLSVTGASPMSTAASAERDFSLRTPTSDVPCTPTPAADPNAADKHAWNCVAWTTQGGVLHMQSPPFTDLHDSDVDPPSTLSGLHSGRASPAKRAASTAARRSLADSIASWPQPPSPTTGVGVGSLSPDVDLHKLRPSSQAAHECACG